MSVMTVQLDGGQTYCHPGAAVTGSVTWDSTGHALPTALEIRLFWFTTGGSAQQVGLMATESHAAPPEAGTHRFRFILPAKPWSFEGRLARLDWAIEAVLLPERACARAAFIVGPAVARTIENNPAAAPQILRLHPPPVPPRLPTAPPPLIPSTPTLPRPSEPAGPGATPTAA